MTEVIQSGGPIPADVDISTRVENLRSVGIGNIGSRYSNLNFSAYFSNLCQTKKFSNPTKTIKTVRAIKNPCCWFEASVEASKLPMPNKSIEEVPPGM